MGYRSDVTLAFYLREKATLGYPALKLWFEENYPTEEAEDDWDAKVVHFEGAEAIIVTYEDVKWYDGYTHVSDVEQAIERFVETFECNSTGNAAYEFVRIGEEPSDIEERGSDNADYILRVRRHVEILFTERTFNKDRKPQPQP